MAEAQKKNEQNPQLSFDRPAALSGRPVILEEEQILPWLHLTRLWWEEKFKAPDYSGKGYRVEFDETAAPADRKVVVYTPSGQGQMHVTPDTHEFHGDAQSDDALIRHALQETATRSPHSNIIKADGEPDFMFRTWCHAQSMALILEGYPTPDLNNLSPTQQKIYDELKRAGMSFPAQAPQGGADAETQPPKKASIGAATSPSPANAPTDQAPANDAVAICPAVAAASAAIDGLKDSHSAPGDVAAIDTGTSNNSNYGPADMPVQAPVAATVAADGDVPAPAALPVFHPKAKPSEQAVVDALAAAYRITPEAFRRTFRKESGEFVEPINEIMAMTANHALRAIEKIKADRLQARGPLAEPSLGAALLDTGSLGGAAQGERRDFSGWSESARPASEPRLPIPEPRARTRGVGLSL